MLELLQSTKINIRLPIIVCVDNMQGLYHDQKHHHHLTLKNVDMKYKFVTEYIEDGVIKIIFVKLADNDSDTMTKNL